MHNKKHIFYLIVIIIFFKNNIVLCSFLPLVKTEWKEEIKNSYPKIYVNKKGRVDIPKDIENLILKSCDFDTLLNISMVNKNGKNTIGYFFYENLADVYNMLKMKAKKHTQSYERLLISHNQDKSKEEIEKYVTEEFEKFYSIDFSILKNNYAMMFTEQNRLIDRWSPFGALTWSSRHVRVDQFEYFILPYVQWVEAMRFYDFSANKEYIQRLQINTHLKDLTINFPENNIFPNLSGCTSLATITIKGFDEKKHTLSSTLKSLKNIPNLTKLDLSRINIGNVKNAINILSQYPKLEVLCVGEIVKYKYKRDNLEKYKKFKEKTINNLTLFNNFSSLKELKIACDSDYFLKFCLYYYKSKNEMPLVLIPYLEKAFNKYKGNVPEELFWDEYPDEHTEKITDYVFSSLYDYLLIKSYQDYTYPLHKKKGHFEKTIQKIIWKEIGNKNDIQKLQEIITTSDYPIYFEVYNQKNIEKQLALLHEAPVDHRKIVGMLIEVIEPIKLNAEYLSKYENLHLSLRIKGKKTHKKNQTFFNFSQGEFATISYVNTNDHMILLEDQSKFPSLNQFIYNNVKNRKYDFDNFRWHHRSYSKHVPFVVFKAFENKNALIWRNEFERIVGGFGGDSILAPHQRLINILFENRTIITNKKIIKLLESIEITYDELKSLEILLQYSYDEISFILKKILSFPGKIKNEEDWKLVQEKYLPVIQEQSELKKQTIINSVKKSKKLIIDELSHLSSLLNNINVWKYMFFLLSFGYLGLLFYMKMLIINYKEKIKNYEELFMEILKKNESKSRNPPAPRLPPSADAKAMADRSLKLRRTGW